jgi:hypothetical protein
MIFKLYGGQKRTRQMDKVKINDCCYIYPNNKQPIFYTYLNTGLPQLTYKLIQHNKVKASVCNFVLSNLLT